MTSNGNDVCEICGIVLHSYFISRNRVVKMVASFILFCCILLLWSYDVNMKPRKIPQECSVPYLKGSLIEPCGYCRVCVKEEKKGITISKCLNPNNIAKDVFKFPLFNEIRIMTGNIPYHVCKNVDYCHPLYDTQSRCDCSEARKDKKGKGECISMLGSCKCGCENNKYGQFCENSIPPGIAKESFADIQNIIYSPLTFANDYASFTIYFYRTGININIEIQTEREILIYNKLSCKNKVPSFENHCNKLFGKGEIHLYEKFCKGSPMYLDESDSIECAVMVNLAFSRVQINPQNENKFIHNNPKMKDFTIKDVVAKLEDVNIVVHNKILGESEKMAVFSKENGFIVIYDSKSHLETCLPRVTIYKYGSTMFDVPSFPRTKEIVVTSTVILNDDPQCENQGDPELNWSIWFIGLNHNEREDIPLFEAFNTPELILKAFMLEFGMYKVKHEVHFVERTFSKETTYCYFKIVPLPLDPIIIGGSLRYVYYKNNLDLITTNITDLNVPLSQQTSVRRIWYCEDTNDPLCNPVETTNLTLTRFGPFMEGKVYNFIMKIKTSTAFGEISQTIIMTSNPVPSLLIECLKNCGGKNFKSDTRDIFYFKVRISLHSTQQEEGNKIYYWTYSTNTGSSSNLDLIRQEEETPNWILIVKKNTLDFDQEYTFKVTGGGDPGGEAQITVKTFKPILLECDISPKEGVAGETKFSVKCSIEDNEPSPMSLTLTFYDTFDKDSLDLRLLASTFVNSVENIVLTRGTVAVFATNIYGAYQDTYLTVLLTTPIVDSKFLEENTKTLENFSKSQGYEQKISFISALCDILNSNLPVKYKAVETFLEAINKKQVSNLVEVELLLTATKDIVCDKNNCRMPSMTGRSYMLLTQILSTTGTFLRNELIRMSRINSEMTTSKVNLLQTTFLQCAGVLLTVHDERLINKKFVDIDYSIHKRFMLGNLETMKALYRVMQGLIIKNIPYIKHKSVHTEHIATWMKDDTPTFFTKGTKDDYEGSYVRISPRLANFLNKKSSSIVLNTMEFKQDPYWWSQTEEVSTEVFSITLGYVSHDQKYTAIKSFVNPIDIFLKKKNNDWGTVEGNVTQPNPTDDIDVNDLAVAIHRIHPPKGSTISLNFTKLEENDVLRVYVSINKRPDYDQLLKGTLITNQFPWYQPLVWTSEDDDILFIGILPGDNVSVGETISYKFELQSQRCQVWYESLWTISGCKLGTESTEELLHCQCTHLSSIAGFLRVPMNSANPFTDYRLFLTLPDNPYVFAFIGTLFLLYIILLIWSVKNDRKDMMKTSVIFLEDNITSDRFGYLVTVFTGSRFCSGTTSNIGIIIHGSDASSRSHILRSPLRDTLKRNYDDWFLLFTPTHLGTISSIQLWTDHSGLSPNWFCDKIYIHDISTNKDYSFWLNKWFGVTQMGIRVESFARPVKIEKEHVTEFFLTNIIYGFRESHLWISIVSRHPRSPISRSQRLSMAMVALMVTLLTSIMFYDVVIPHIEEPSSYSIQATQILICFYSLAMASVITSMVFLAFKKSYGYHYLKESTAKKQHKGTNDKGFITGSKPGHRMAKYAKQGISKLKKKYFYPVQIRTDEKQIFFVKKVWAAFAWILCISTIVITCFYIILLGLKIGKVKSLLWLTSTVMSLGSDLCFVDPGKIVFIALILGVVQTQVCNLYAYDPNIYQLRKGPYIKIDLNQDLFVHKLRLHPAYKRMSKESLKLIQTQINKIKNWWAFIDSFDICFLVIAAFCVISEAVSGEYTNNSFFKKLLFKNVNSGGNYQPTMSISSIPSYSQYIQDTILPAIYVTHWYNKLPLTADNEQFEDTGWTRDAAHRMMGIPRLRQIRTVQKSCNIPKILLNVTMYCNVRFSSSTEDIDDYGAEWKKVIFYRDVVFSGHPWLYTFPEQSSSLSLITESDKIFHGGGYIAELKRNRRESEDTVFSLLDSGWLDARTRVVFFETTIYGVNENVFTSIIFLTEHLESTLIISGERVWSIIIQKENVFDIIFFMYAILGITKLIMILNTVGVTTFVTSFWPMYDLGLVCIVISYFLGHRVYLFMSSLQYEEFQKSGKDTPSQFLRLILDLHLFRILLGLLFMFAMIRTLRLLKYGTRLISQKQKYTLYFSWPKILWMTLALITILFSLQRLVGYTLNTLYPIRISNFAAYKMSFNYLSKRAIPSGNKMFVLLPCFASIVAMVFYVLVLVKSYSISSIVYEREKLA